MKYHMDKHNGKLQEFPCLVCSKTFNSLFFLKSHVAQQHESGVAFKCDLCSEEFKYSKQLERHKADHEMFKLF